MTAPHQTDIADADTRPSHPGGHTPPASRTGGRLSRLLARVALLSSSTRAVRDELAASPPQLSGELEQPATVPQRLPVIPGVVDLEPRARGGMGIIYRGRDEALGRPLAVKVMWPSHTGSETACKRAKREALLLALVSHPNVVTVHAAGETDGSPYIVMEWVDGPSLQQRIGLDRPTPQQAARIVRDLASAVAAIHNVGVIHRDIKPDNVLLAGCDAADWSVCKPKLADFGLARPAERPREITQHTTALGTPAYMAPEQTGMAEDLGPIGPAVDIHGLGALAFALLTGTAPYAADSTIASLHRAADGDIRMPPAFHRLPRSLRAILETCLQRRPEDRYPSATAVAEDLNRFLSGRPVHARPLSPATRLARTACRKPVGSVAIALAVVIFIWAAGSLARNATPPAPALNHAAPAAGPASVATGSLNLLTGERIEKIVLQSSPDDQEHVAYLRDVREEFANWPLGEDPAEGLRQRLNGLRRVAGLFFDISHFDDALQCHEESLAVLDALAIHEPDAIEVLRQRLRSLQYQRSCLYHLGRHDEAVASAETAIGLLRAAPADMPNRERELNEQVMALGGFLQELGRFDEAASTMDMALAGFDRLRAADPENPDLVMRQSHGLYVAQLCAHRSNHPDRCRQLVTRLVEEIGGFLKTHPVDSLPQATGSLLTKNVGLGLSQLARLAAAEGRLEEAVGHALAQRALCQTFLETLPSDAIDPVHKELIDAGLHVATLLLQAGREEEAAAAVEQAETTARFLYDSRPRVFDNAYLIGWVSWMRGDIARRRGDAKAAAAQYEQTIAVLTPWTAQPACRDLAESIITSAKEALATLSASVTTSEIPVGAAEPGQPLGVAAAELPEEARVDQKLTKR